MEMSMRKDVKVLMNEMKGIREAMDFMNSRFEQTLKELTESRKENVKLKAKVDVLDERVKVLEGKVMSMGNKLVQNNLEVTGVPCSTEENCSKIALTICKKVNPDIKEDDIEDAYRIGSVKDRDGNAKSVRPLLIKFRSTQGRNIIYKNKKILRKVDTKQLDFSNNSKLNIYINENLQHETKALLRETNIARKEKEWKYLWTNFGMIYVRQNDSSKIICIRSKEDLKVIV